MLTKDGLTTWDHECVTAICHFNFDEFARKFE